MQPALDRQIALMKGLRATATHDAGVWRLPQGADYYAQSLAQATTTTLSPAEVHRLGLEKVAELSATLDVTLKAQGYATGTVGERLRALYQDPKFRYPNTDEGKEKLLADLNAKVGEITKRLPDYFGNLPKAPLLIKRVPKETEAGAPGGYYNGAALDGSRPGMYYINLRDTAETPSWTLPTLTFHEGIPGHHLQISLAQESNLPIIRRVIGFNAYQEGWALYAEQLADEMGMYDHDPMGRIGYLHDALFRAVRLVVDTGLHDLRWTREQTVTYYVDNLGDQEASAVTEVERYCVEAGQACSYMVGKLTWLRLRAKAQAALGAKFDIRQFHDACLSNGAMPLAVLETVVDQYIAKTGGGVKADGAEPAQAARTLRVTLGGLLELAYHRKEIARAGIPRGPDMRMRLVGGCAGGFRQGRESGRCVDVVTQDRLCRSPGRLRAGRRGPSASRASRNAGSRAARALTVSLNDRVRVIAHVALS